MAGRAALLFLILGALAGLMLGGCASARRYEFERVCMGVRTRVVTYAPAGNAARVEAAAASAFHVISTLDAAMSDYRPDSEVSRLGADAGSGAGSGAGLVVSDDLARVLDAAARVSAATDGAFDVTVGPIVRLWRESRRSGRLPTPDRLDAARSLVDWRRVRVTRSPEGHALVRLETHGMALDLGGIAKGYAAQRARDHLAAAGLPRSMVALDGDIAVGDPPPGTRGWSVQSGADGLVYTLRNASISTSGDEHQHVEIDGVRYSHVVDPRTGLGLVNAPTVTVIGPDGAIVDALATAACGGTPAQRSAHRAALIARFGVRLIDSADNPSR